MRLSSIFSGRHKERRTDHEVPEAAPTRKQFKKAPSVSIPTPAPTDRHSRGSGPEWPSRNLRSHSPQGSSFGAGSALTWAEPREVNV